MAAHPNITDDELLGLVAGTLDEEDFLRVAKAVRNDVALQAKLAVYEKIRSDLVDGVIFDRRQSAIDVFAESLIQHIDPSRPQRRKPHTGKTWLSWLGKIFVASSAPARFAYCLVVIQAVGIAWLLSSALQIDDSSMSTRAAGADSKQLGAVPGSVTFSVSFDPAASESAVRGLLLELEAQIIAGPSQLGQYKIVVARNRGHLALLKLRETNFVEQVTESANESDKSDARDKEKK